VPQTAAEMIKEWESLLGYESGIGNVAFAEEVTEKVVVKAGEIYAE